MTFPLSYSRCRAGSREVRAWWDSFPLLKEEIFCPAAVFANVPTLSCSEGDAGVVSLNFSHCPSCWKPVLLPLEHSKLEIHLISPETPPEMDADCPSSSWGWANTGHGCLPWSQCPGPLAGASCHSGPFSLPCPGLARWKCCSIKPSHLPQARDGSESPGKCLVAWQSCSGRRKAPC